MTRSLRFRAAVERAIHGVAPAKLVLLGYLACVIVGWILLALPFASVDPSATPLDHLFIATSAVSTTGLAMVNPPGTYSLFGELVILGLIQIGGIGYMTIGSFLVLTRGRTLTKSRERLLASDFAMPKEFALTEFVRGVVIFTVTAEVLGAVALWALFANAGVEHALYQAVFHSVSAFCTAGFSLFDTSLEGFAGNAGVNAVVAALAYLGAIGFIVAVDAWRVGVGRQKHLTFTSKIISLGFAETFPEASTPASGMPPEGPVMTFEDFAVALQARIDSLREAMGRTHASASDLAGNDAIFQPKLCQPHAPDRLPFASRARPGGLCPGTRGHPLVSRACRAGRARGNRRTGAVPRRCGGHAGSHDAILA
ncbi:MAG: potassium transporter TrkG [Bacteroidota bacterium]